jgi:hypothetical protein
MPKEGSIMKFKNYKNKLKRPFIVYADMEATLEIIDEKNKITKHNVNSCCYYFVCSFDNSRNYIKTFVGDNCVTEMLIELMDLSEKCIEEMRQNEDIKLNKEDKINYQKC